MPCGILRGGHSRGRVAAMRKAFSLCYPQTRQWRHSPTDLRRQAEICSARRSVAQTPVIYSLWLPSFLREADGFPTLFFEGYATLLQNLSELETPSILWSPYQHAHIKSFMPLS